MQRLSLVAGALAMILAGAASVRADDQADAKAIIEKALKAQGGADKADKNKTFSSKMKGKLHVMGLELDYSAMMHTQEPDRVRFEMDLTIMGKEFKVLQIFNKDKGWLKNNDMTMEMTKDMIASAKEQMYNSEVNRLKPVL